MKTQLEFPGLKQTVPFSMKLDKKLCDQLHEAADEQKITMREIVEYALKKYMEELQERKNEREKIDQKISRTSEET